GGAQHVHGDSLAGRFQKVQNLPGNRAVCCQFRFEGIELAGFGQASVPQQVDNLFKSGVIRQRMDVVSAIAQDAGVSVDITDLRLSGDHAFKARPGCRAHQMSFARQYSKSHCNTERQVKSQRSKVKSRKWCDSRSVLVFREGTSPSDVDFGLVQQDTAHANASETTATAKARDTATASV